MFCKLPFKAFLEGQMSEDKPTTLLAVKNLSSFHTQSSYSAQYLFSTSVTTNHWFKKKRNK